MIVVDIKGEALETRDLVGLNVNPNKDDFLKIGRIIFGTFPGTERVSGSLGAGSENRSGRVEVFYRVRNQRGIELDKVKRAGPDSFRERYMQLGGSFQVLQKEYRGTFGEDFSFY